MPMDLTWFERQIFLRRNWGPGPILDIFSILAFQAIHTAIKIRVFETLEARGPCSVQDLCRHLGADEKGLTLIMGACEALGYLRKRPSGRYTNSPMTRQWMLADGPAQLSRVFDFFHDVFLRWSELDKAILNQRASRLEEVLIWLNSRPGAWERYHEGVLGVATLIAPQLAAAVELPPTARNLIDIGGSHGLYSIALCQRYPSLSAQIYDLAHAKPIAERTAASNGMSDRVTFTAGDIITGSPAGRYDVVLLVNTLRGFSSEKATAVIAKIYGLLNPGGMAIIADQFRLPARTRFSRLNAMLILLELYNGGTTIYTDSQVSEMLCAAGFTETKFVKLRRTPGIHLITGKRPQHS